MKNKKQPVIKTVRSKLNGDLFYTCIDWPEKEIDGVKFISVAKSNVDIHKQKVFLLKKDSIDYVKL